MTKVAIGLGANLGHPVKQIKAVVKALREHSSIAVLAVSRFYCGSLMGPDGPLLDQPKCVNAALTLHTDLAAKDLFKLLKTLEKGLGRPVEHARWASRVIDCDILLYGRESIDDPGLSVPHRGLVSRPFVLQPLTDIAGDWVLPDGRRVDALAEVCGCGDLIVMNEEVNA